MCCSWRGGSQIVVAMRKPTAPTCFASIADNSPSGSPYARREDALNPLPLLIVGVDCDSIIFLDPFLPPQLPVASKVIRKCGIHSCVDLCMP